MDHARTLSLLCLLLLAACGSMNTAADGPVTEGTIRQLRAQIVAAEDSVANEIQRLDALRAKVHAGEASQMQVDSAERSLERAQTRVDRCKTRLAEAEEELRRQQAAGR